MAEENTNMQEQKPKSKLPIKTILIVIGVLFLEGGTITVFKVMHKPTPAEGSTPIVETQDNPENNTAEISLAEGSVDNYVSGRSLIRVTLEVHAKVKKADQEKMAQLATEHKTEIRDRIRFLVSSAQPEDLKDPKLQVIKREIQSDIEKIIGEGLILEILMPVWQSYSMD